MKGQYFLDQSTEDGLEKACNYFKRALDADPSYSLAYQGMANCYISQSSAGHASAAELMPKAKAMAMKAIELDDSLAEGHIALGLIHLNYEWNWAAARAQLERAARLAPTNIRVH